MLEALLEIAASSTTYRRRYLATLQAAPVVDLLLCDETNPRSALFQLEALAAHVDALPRATRTTRGRRRRSSCSRRSPSCASPTSPTSATWSSRASAGGSWPCSIASPPTCPAALELALAAAYFNHAVFSS